MKEKKKKVVKDHKENENNIIIFSESKANFDRYTKAKINNSNQSGRERFQNFPGATSGELLHYMDPTLAEGNYDTAIVHVGINDIINDDGSTKVENLVLNLENIAIKLKKYGIKNVCLSSLVFKTRVYLPLSNQVNKCILDICKAHNISFINNDNINDIYSDGLHLLLSDKFLLSNNFIENIKNFLEMYTHHPHVPIHIPLL